MKSSRVILLLALAYFATTVALLTLWTFSAHRSAEKAQADEAARVVTLLEERFRRTVNATDAILRQAQKAAQDTLAAGRVLGEVPSDRLQGLGASLPDEGSLWVVDANGSLIAGSTTSALPSANYTDREFFSVHQSGEPFVISGGNKGRVTGKYHWRISRRIDGPDGSFAGTVLAQLQAESLEQLQRAVGIGANSVFVVYRQDGPLLIRYPMEERFLSSTLKGDPWFEGVWQSPSQSGVYRKAATSDQVERTYSWRKMAGQPVAIFVGVPVRYWWEAWREQGWMFGGVFAISLAPLFLLLVQGTRSARDELRQRERLEMAVAERTGQLSHALAAAKRADEAKSRFLAAASHDLRQPMQSLFLFASALHRYVQDDKGRAALEHLERGLDTLKSLLDSLLDMSRLDAGAVKPSIEDFQISPLLEHISAGYAPVAQGKGLAWRMASGSYHVRSDRVLLGRLIRNLVENAIRYTREGNVEIDCRVIGDRLRIEVRDTGIGIPPAHLNRIFEEFHQVDNAERDRNQGLGLGLAIVQRISHLLDLPVEVRSEPGRGSTFSVDVSLGETSASLEPPGTSGVSTEHRQERLALVIDDDAMVLMGLQTLLTEWGHDVLIAGSGGQAVEKLKTRNRRPDVIVSDYRLRHGEVGTAAILAVRAWCGADVPGIIMTGETGSECQRDAAEHGFSVMHKPVTARQLSAALERHWATTQQNAERQPTNSNV